MTTVIIRVPKPLRRTLRVAWADLEDAYELEDIPEDLYYFYREVFISLLLDALAIEFERFLGIQTHDFRIDLTGYFRRVEEGNLFEIDDISDCAGGNIAHCIAICDEAAGYSINNDEEWRCYALAVCSLTEALFSDSNVFIRLAKKFRPIFEEHSKLLMVDVHDFNFTLKLHSEFATLRIKEEV